MFEDRMAELLEMIDAIASDNPDLAVYFETATEAGIVRIVDEMDRM